MSEAESVRSEAVDHAKLVRAKIAEMEDKFEIKVPSTQALDGSVFTAIKTVMTSF